MSTTPNALRRAHVVASNRRPRRRLLLLLLALALVCFVIKAPVTAWLEHAPRVIRVGSDWGSGHIVVPQRAGATPQTRKTQSDRAALLARQRGLAIVATGDAVEVAVIQKNGGKK